MKYRVASKPRFLAMDGVKYYVQAQFWYFPFIRVTGNFQHLEQAQDYIKLIKEVK